MNIDEEPSRSWWQQFLDALKFDKIEARQSNIDDAYKATCKWFLKSPEYLAWSDSAQLSEHHGFLWLSGKPGAGKSTIMKFAFTRAKRTLKISNAVISFFFNARGVVLEKSTTGMYRSLLLQLLQSFPDLQKACEDSTLDIRNGSCPSLESTQISFRNAISMLGKRSLTCFIDALDECDEFQVRHMVEYFESLGQQAVENQIELRICFSSRHYPYIFIQKGLRFTLEDQKGHEEDVQQYVRDKLKGEPGPLLEDIEAQVLQKSAGVFMWVVLVVDILNKEFSRGRMFAVQKRLAKIPAKLSGLFKDILTRDNENMEDLLLCLQWILYAKQPLAREEFYFAISTGLMNEDELTRNYLVTSVSSDMMDRFVVSSSKGLVEVTKSNQHTVQFIHESVRDFLIKDNGLQELWPEFGDGFEKFGHDKLRQCCHRYWKLGVTHLLDWAAFPGENRDMKELRATVSKQAPFLRYATQNVLYHADIAASSMLQDSFLAELKIEDWILSSNLFEDYKVRRYTVKASLFYILADKGFSALIQAKLRHDPNCCTLGERYHYPIFAALINGYDDAVQALLGQTTSNTEESKSSRCIRNVIYESIPKDGKLFLWAVNNGYAPVVEFLIERGADVNIKDQSGKPPIFIAAKKGHAGIVKLLVGRSTDIDFQDPRGPYMTALIIAVEKGYHTIAEILIENGANMNAGDIMGRRSLTIAIQKKEEVMIQLLLEKGADINAKDLRNRTPLFYAIEQGNQDAMQLLLEKGADINAKDFRDQTPLIYAIEQGKQDAVQLLLDKGIDMKDDIQQLLNKHAAIKGKYYCGQTQLMIAIKQGEKDAARLCSTKGEYIRTLLNCGQTPLLYALGLESTNDIVQLLIEQSEDINYQDNHGRIPLLYAMQQRRDNKIIRLIIEKGADVNVKDKRGRTPLFLAVYKMDYNIARQLIEEGADVNAKDMYGDTPLLFAIRMNENKVTQLLLEKGADVNITNDKGQTALSISFEMGNNLIIQFLIERGADSSSVELGEITSQEHLDIHSSKSFDH
jgi:ankyrin repeat protein